MDSPNQQQQPKMIKLILKCQTFLIPSDFRFIKDINADVYSQLIKDKIYYIKSNVSENVLQSFINHWIYNKAPLINNNNISEFIMLSEEFDRMKDLIQLVKNANSNTFLLINKKDDLKKRVKKYSELLNEKKTKHQQIIRHLFNNNGIDSHSKFLEIKNELFRVCINKDLILVDLLTRKKFNENGLLLALNETEKTAGVFRNLTSKGDVFIPRSINYESQEFVITDIFDEAFCHDQNIKSIQFPKNSELRRIGKYSFSFSSIEKIVIPSRVNEIGESAFAYCNQLKIVEFDENTELKTFKEGTFSNSINHLTIPSGVEKLCDRWCFEVFNLNVIVSPNNKVFKNFDKFVIGKSDKESEIYDVLYFANRDVESAKIPNFIKIIAPYAFSHCQKLKSIEFEAKSELKLIGHSSFSYSPIKRISIPSQVIHIENFAFSNCDRLSSVEFSIDSELRSIEEFTFCGSVLENISLPHHVNYVGECTFSNCERLTKVDFSENSEIKKLDKSLFSKSAIESLSIPSNIENFEKNWCREISDLNNIKIYSKKEKNIVYYDDSFILGKSDLKSDNFDILLFARRNIEKVIIPSFIKQIGPYAFSECNKLESIEFEDDSKLEKIGQYAFSKSPLKKFLIPQNVTQISEGSFCLCSQLKSVEISEGSKLDSIDEYSFYSCPLESISIPSSFTNFTKAWCFGITKLTHINIFQCKETNIIYYQNSFILGKSDTKSDIFDVLLFARRNIRKVTIPSFIKKLASYAFSECQNLGSIEFQENSELVTIENYCFSFTSLTKILIPKNVKQLMEAAFFNCSGLKNIYFEDKSELKSIEKSTFYKTSLESIIIPPNVTSIKVDAFSNCQKLQIVEISENSKLNSINKNIFQDSSLDVIMIPNDLKKSVYFII